MNKQNLKNQRAITLIALIITILILLILAVVAIQSVNGDGIIKHAQDAKTEYEIAQEKEQIGLALSEWQIQKNYPIAGQTFESFMTSKLVDTGVATSVVGNDSGSLTIIMKSENIYTVDENGNITKQENGEDKITNDFEITVSHSNSDLYIYATIPDSWNDREFTEEDAVKIVAKDIFGKGPTITTLKQLNLEIYNFYTTIDDAKNPIFGAPTATDFEDMLTKFSTIIGNDYTNATEQEFFTIVLSLMESPFTTVEEWATDIYEYEPTTKVLKIRKNGGEWIDITNKATWRDDGYDHPKYQIIANGVYEIQLELDDKKAISEPIEVVDINLGKYVIYDIDGDRSVEDETILWRVLRNDKNKVELISAEALGSVVLGSNAGFNEARTKYNNAVDLIVAECKRVTGITENIRNVGGPAIDVTTMNDTVDFSELTTFSPTVSIEEFNKYEGTENGLKKGDEEEKYLEDYNQMEKSRTTGADNSQTYWLASRLVDENSYYVSFCVRHIGPIDGSHSCFVYNDADAYDSSPYANARAVRPVLTLESGTLDNTAQIGTKDDPIEIYQDK